MRKILVLAYSVSPTKGSEFAVAWNYITKMSEENELVVLYGTSGPYVGQIEDMEAYVACNEVKNVRFIPVKPTKLTYLLNWPAEHIFWQFFYMAYNHWHKLAYKEAKKLVSDEHFDLVHYLGPIGYREPGYLWMLKLPYMWGPIGGASNIREELIEPLSLSSKMIYRLKNCMNTFQLKYGRRIRKAIDRCDLLLTATTENQELFQQEHRVKTIYTPENAIIKQYELNEAKFKDIERVELVFVGQIDSRKSLITLLQALSLMENKKLVLLNVIGDGPLVASLKQFCKDEGIEDSVIWHGAVPRDRVFELMNRSHLHIITSIMEANTTVIWEAMSKGVPTLSLKHCGMRDVITDDCGFLIEINSYDQIVKDIANVLDCCTRDHAMLRSKALGVVERSKNYLWTNRVDMFNECYETAINNYWTSTKK